MPNNSPSDRLEWNEENLSKVIADLYAEAETDQALHDQLLADPFEVLDGRIIVPDDYRGGIFARERNKKTLALYVPETGRTRASLPEGTTDAVPQLDYEILCTLPTEW